MRDPTALPYRAGGALAKKYGAEVLIRRGSHSAIADELEIADLQEAAQAVARARRDQQHQE